MKKTVFITGATGGIGGAAARYYTSHGWDVIAPVRSLAKPEAQELLKISGIHVVPCDVEDAQQAYQLIQSLKNDGRQIDRLFLSAGVFLWDDGFPGPARTETQVKTLLDNANYRTKVNVIDACAKFYSTANITLEMVGSHAADFVEGHPLRNGEAGYADTMLKVRSYAHQLTDTGAWGSVILYEPGLIDTPMAREAFTPEKAPDIDWSKAKTPASYIAEIYANTTL